MSDYGLSSQQLAVISALSNGATLSDAAAEAGVHRNTITNWRRSCIPFQFGFASAQYDRAILFREKTEGLIDLAVLTLHDILADPNTPASVRLKAALAVIQTAATPPEPKKQIELDIQKVVVHRNTEDITEEQIAPAQPEKVHKDAQSESQPAPVAAQKPEIVHNSAQKVGRNEPCPCGSNQKFKRCCLDKVEQMNRATSAAA
jgi:uncharacterized protein YchJ